MIAIDYLSKSSLKFDFKENKKQFHKIYSVRISFTAEFYSYEVTNDLMSEWINHHKAAFNSVWIQPEFCPTSRRVHYHGLVDVKDQFKLNLMLRLFKPVGSFHLETLHDMKGFITYCNKEVSQTECMEHAYNKYIVARESRAPKVSVT